MSEVWLFYGAGARFASGAFSDQKEAMEWIEKHKLTGLLTKYPLDVGVYEWAIKNEFFLLKRSMRALLNLSSDLRAPIKNIIILKTASFNKQFG